MSHNHSPILLQKRQEYFDLIQQESGKVHDVLHFTPNNVNMPPKKSEYAEAVEDHRSPRSAEEAYLIGIHANDFPLQIIGVPLEQASAEQRSELETYESWQQGIHSSLKEDGYTRLVDAYGKFPADQPATKDNSRLDAFLASEIYEITPQVQRILDEHPEIRATYENAEGKEKEFVYFVNYALSGVEAEGKPSEKIETKLNSKTDARRYVEYAVLDQAARAMQMATENGGKIVASFFECENPEKVHEMGAEVTREMHLRPRLFGALAQQFLGKDLEVITNYIQPYLDNEIQLTDEDKPYCRHLNSYFVPMPGQSSVPAVQKLAFLDRFFETFTDHSIRDHMQDSGIRAMVEGLQAQMVKEHEEAQKQGTSVQFLSQKGRETAGVNARRGAPFNYLPQQVHALQDVTVATESGARKVADERARRLQSGDVGGGGFSAL